MPVVASVAASQLSSGCGGKVVAPSAGARRANEFGGCVSVVHDQVAALASIAPSLFEPSSHTAKLCLPSPTFTSSALSPALPQGNALPLSRRHLNAGVESLPSKLKLAAAAAVNWDGPVRIDARST